MRHPVVGNRVGDLPRLIKDGFNGYIINNDNVCEKLNRLLENPPDWKENCVNSIAPYRTDKFIEKIKQLYNEVIS